ncbi:DUF3105 domain-containing protein [Specibacter cremeus]|uniref:DUF3105 domain-containing protein n=1 Tax=Specibacter cremeus TaxID=1629051 RepID=UPI001F0CAC3D|nr:DUF3105 domain-containing protein [Specibacter cremeus]
MYTNPVNEERAVHSLEHGAVWISHKPDLSPADLGRLTGLATGKPYVLLSPNPDQLAPVTATAWGTQLEIPNAGTHGCPSSSRPTSKGHKPPNPGPRAPAASMDNRLRPSAALSEPLTGAPTCSHDGRGRNTTYLTRGRRAPVRRWRPGRRPSFSASPPRRYG